jgi:hypothetical protein
LAQVAQDLHHLQVDKTQEQVLIQFFQLSLQQVAVMELALQSMSGVVVDLVEAVL